MYIHNITKYLKIQRLYFDRLKYRTFLFGSPKDNLFDSL